MNRLFIIGAGGHGKVIADIALKNGYTDVSFLDDYATGHCMGFAIKGTTCVAESLNDDKTDFIIGVGNNSIRRKIAESHSGLNYATLIHPSAQIGLLVNIGKGTVVMPGVIINSCAEVGEHCIINSAAVVEHDDVLADFVHISPNATLGGTVCVGEATHIGIGTTIRNNVNICSGCTIGAGAVVVKDIITSGIYVGVPAVRLDKGK